jgi:RNA polymerase sigma-70 factor (ECF subfamily)
VTERDARLRAELEANGAMILNYFERRVGLDDAPDLLAEVMLVAWRRVRVSPEEAQQARMWLFGDARNGL